MSPRPEPSAERLRAALLAAARRAPARVRRWLRRLLAGDQAEAAGRRAAGAETPPK